MFPAAVDPNLPPENLAGPNYRPPFAFANPACYGEAVQSIDAPSIEMALALIKSKKDVEAIAFAKGDITKYENIRGDYVFSSQFKDSNIRFQTMTYKDCYERDILTNEIPSEPTFQFWETSNIRMQNIPGEVPHH